jgi:citronellol/citronellal dehydrogenase
MKACAGRVALVTGASRGIGEATAYRLAAEGAAVAVVARTEGAGDSPLAGSLDETVQRIRAAGGTASAFPADLADPGYDHRALVARVSETLGPVDILVNGAAAIFAGSFDDLSPKRMGVAVQVNVWSPWALMAAVAPAMRSRGRGWIVNLTSVAARSPHGPPFTTGHLGGSAVYGGTKALLDRMTVGAAADLWGSGVAVNAVAPRAAVRTEGAGAVVDLPEDRIEPVEVLVEAVLALATAEPTTLTGRVTTSTALLRELDRPVHDLDGRELVAGWQPADLAALDAPRPE